MRPANLLQQFLHLLPHHAFTDGFYDVQSLLSYIWGIVPGKPRDGPIYLFLGKFPNRPLFHKKSVIKQVINVSPVSRLLARGYLYHILFPIFFHSQDPFAWNIREADRGMGCNEQLESVLAKLLPQKIYDSGHDLLLPLGVKVDIYLINHQKYIFPHVVLPGM